MPAALDLTLNASAFVLFPLIVYSLWTGSKAPPGSWAEKYSNIEPWLMIIENSFLLSICATCAVNLAKAFGLIGASTQSTLVDVLVSPFLILIAAYFGLILRGKRELRAKL